MKNMLMSAWALTALMAAPALAAPEGASLLTEKGAWSGDTVYHASTNPCTAKPCRAMVTDTMTVPPPVPHGVTIIPALGESGEVLKTGYVPILDKPQSIDSNIARGLPKDMDFVTDDGVKMTGAQLAKAWNASLAGLDNTAPKTQ